VPDNDSTIDMPGLSALELARIAPLPEAAHLSGVCKDTLKRHHRDKLVVLSPRRLGMRVRDALMLAKKI
jgi:hypothetical protein